MNHADTMAGIFAEPFGKSKPMPATIRDGWTMPSGTCLECGAELEPVAVRDGDSIGPCLECPEQCSDPIDVDWPFVQDAVMRSDFEALGFEGGGRMITPRQLDRELYDEAREQGRDVEELASGGALLSGIAAGTGRAPGGKGNPPPDPETCDLCGAPATGRLWTGEVTCDRCSIGKDGEPFEELGSSCTAQEVRTSRFRTSPAQTRVIELLRAGRRLFWFGDEGPEMSGESFWPQKRTVRAMLKAGLLRWLPYANPSQRECGTRELALSDKGAVTPTDTRRA